MGLIFIVHELDEEFQPTLDEVFFSRPQLAVSIMLMGFKS
jgi:hypothetical protein